MQRNLTKEGVVTLGHTNRLRPATPGTFLAVGTVPRTPRWKVEDDYRYTCNKINECNLLTLNQSPQAIVWRDNKFVKMLSTIYIVNAKTTVER